MANTLVQFRADEAARIQAVRICEKLGIDLATYLRICMAKLIQENGVPFSMKLDSQEDLGIRAMKTASQIAAENGLSEMTLEEINEEIARTRQLNG